MGENRGVSLAVSLTAMRVRSRRSRALMQIQNGLESSTSIGSRIIVIGMVEVVQGSARRGLSWVVVCAYPKERAKGSKIFCKK